MRKIFLVVVVFLLMFYPVNALEIATLSFSKNVSSILPLFTADKTKVVITSFSAEKNNYREVPLYLLSVVNLSKAVVYIKYDNSVIEAKNIFSGDVNISYSVENGVKITLDLNESITGDFLIARIKFKAIGNEGESTPLIIEVNQLLDNNSNEIPYLTVNGMFYIPYKEHSNENHAEDTKLDSTLIGLITAENKSKFANENNLEVKNNKVKVIMETNNTTKTEFVNIEDLPYLTDNTTIKSVRAYRKSSNIPLICIALLIFIVVSLTAVRYLK